MESTHHDEHTCADILALFAGNLEGTDSDAMNASPVYSCGTDESVDRGMEEKCAICLLWMFSSDAKFNVLVGG